MQLEPLFGTSRAVACLVAGAGMLCLAIACGGAGSNDTAPQWGGEGAASVSGLAPAGLSDWGAAQATSSGRAVSGLGRHPGSS